MLQQALEKFAGHKSLVRERYDNYIGGAWVAPAQGDYFDNISPVTGQVVCQVARGTAADIEAALDAAHAAKDAWGKLSSTERSNTLLKIADRMEANLDLIAMVETIDNGKPIREMICPLLSGPKSLLFWTTKELGNGQEAQAGRDHRQAA